MKFLVFLGEKAILVWSFLLFLLLGISSILVRTNMPMDGSELSNMQTNGIVFFISLAVFLVLLYFLCSLVFIKESYLFIFGTIFYLIFGVYLILH